MSCPVTAGVEGDGEVEAEGDGEADDKGEAELEGLLEAEGEGLEPELTQPLSVQV